MANFFSYKKIPDTFILPLSVGVLNQLLKKLNDYASDVIDDASDGL